MNDNVEEVIGWGIISTVNAKGLYQATYYLLDPNLKILTKENLIIRPSLTEKLLMKMPDFK